MIKREYFIYAEAHLKCGRVQGMWRQFSSRTFFANPLKALNELEGRLSKESGVDVDSISIKSFNRC